MKKSNSLNLQKNSFAFLPLGGANEIGMNLNMYHHEGKWIIIDCGVGFADEEIPGVTLLTPKIDFIIQNKDKICGLVITHIHEDHIGAIAYLWNYIKCPVYCTPLARSFLEFKLKDRGYNPDRDVKITELTSSNRIFHVGPFQLEALGITHSVPEMLGLKIETPFGPIFHTGDWKFDDKPVVGQATNYKTLKEFGKNGIYAIVCDSTNVFNAGSSGSEGDLEKNLINIVKKQENRVVITTFASNLARLHTIAAVAAKTKRKLVVAGFSLWRIISIARKNGYLLDDIHDFYEAEDANSLDRKDVIILCTGCQGEPTSALSKMAVGEHKVRIQSGDTVIFSSKIIPGNDKKIFGIFNKLTDKDINIITERAHHVHVSGHPNRDELKKMYSLLNPRFSIPVHGEQYHIAEHAELARSFGVEEAYRVKNGDVLEFFSDGIKKVGTVTHGRMCIDGTILRDSTSLVIEQRRKISDSGAVFVNVILSSNENFVFAPVFEMPGFLDQNEDLDLYKQLETLARAEIADIIENYNQSVKSKEAEVKYKIENRLSKIFMKYTGKSPLIKAFVKII